MRLVITKLIFLLFFQAAAQSFSKETVIEDLNYLIRSIEKYNPSLSIYQPNYRELAFESLQTIEGDSISFFDYYSKVSALCSIANEGHFKIGNWEDQFKSGFISNTYAYMPIEVKIIGGKMYVYKDYSQEQILKKGDEIIRINGLKTDLILNYLSTLIPSDGNIQTYTNRKLEENFSWMYYLHVQQNKSHQFKIIDKNKECHDIELSALVRSKQVKNFEKYYAGRIQEDTSEKNGFYKFEIKENYALLKLPSFDFRKVNRFKVKSSQFYKSIFSELKEKKVQNLIIDLRNNTGGRNEFADDIIPFISKEKSIPFLKKTLSWDGKEKSYRQGKISKYLFLGEIYVLTNGKTFSSGSILARYLKEYGEAKIIGMETGSRYEGFAAGSNQYIKLPNSGLEIGIPRYYIFFPKSKKQKTENRGLLPDYEVNNSYEEFDQKKDVWFTKAIELIHQNKNSQ